MKRHVFALAVSLALVIGCGTGDTRPSGPATATTSTSSGAACSRGRAFVVVRHAEKASTDKDTSLSERGQARAKVLASMLASAGVTRLVATQYKRTQETLAPLAERTSLTVDVRPAEKTAELVGELRAAPDGAVVVIATHSNILPLIVKELGGTQLRGVEGDTLPEDDYSRVVVITHACGASLPFVMELGSDG
ncbi:MAG TPA: phosphoglycerate mutase family protein [Labilithrix sp.]|nr:phosphoglycerate mutase family protein [Labilithrix sp.]